MGQQGSKSSMEPRVIFHRVGVVDMYPRTDSVVHIQKKVTAQSVSPRSAARALEKSSPHSWPLQSRGDGAGLVYVMDNPTGGVWVKPGPNWTRS